MNGKKIIVELVINLTEEHHARLIQQAEEEGFESLEAFLEYYANLVWNMNFSSEKDKSNDR